MGRWARNSGLTDNMLAVHDYVMQNQGASFSQIANTLLLKNGTARYSIETLEHEGFMSRKRDAGDDGKKPNQRYSAHGNPGAVQGRHARGQEKRCAYPVAEDDYEGTF